MYFRCSGGRIYNAFAGPSWQGPPHRWRVLGRILQGVAQGTPTLPRAQALGIDRKHLLERRHKIQALAAAACDRSPLPDHGVEVDERYQNAGEKGVRPPDPEDPRRALGPIKREVRVRATVTVPPCSGSVAGKAAASQ